MIFEVPLIRINTNTLYMRCFYSWVYVDPLYKIVVVGNQQLNKVDFAAVEQSFLVTNNVT